MGDRAARHRRRLFRPRAPGIDAGRRAAWLARTAVEGIDVSSIRAYLEAIQAAPHFEGEFYTQLTKRMARAGHPMLSKAKLRAGYESLAAEGALVRDARIEALLTKKPTRSNSGVAPVTIFTKPHPCPGRCIFCPTDPLMPKSYLSNEPGGQRALTLGFAPYEQVQQRLRAMQNTGHPVDKVDLIIVGGTWSSYPADYREWFVQRAFDGLNDTPSTSLAEAQRRNETAAQRCTGIVIETRADHINLEEIIHLRRLGVTRVQLGVQTLNDAVSALNKRGETSDQVRQAVRLLRGAGFKIVLHWMPNLLGATLDSDRADFARFWADPALRPDEMKLYPTGLMFDTELYDHYLAGAYHPYTEAELTSLLADCMAQVPPYCRLNRVMRDIPAPEIAAGVTTSNLRERAEQVLRDQGRPCRCVRCREIGATAFDASRVTYHPLTYETDHSREVFLQAETDAGHLAGFLRLSLPVEAAPLPELAGAAVIRQVQVYGPALPLQVEAAGRAQHSGLGRALIAQAGRISRQAGFARLAVIAAVGTREYYRRQGFHLGDLYMSQDL